MAAISVLVFYAFILLINSSYLLRFGIFFVHVIQQNTTLKPTIVFSSLIFKYIRSSSTTFFSFFSVVYCIIIVSYSETQMNLSVIVVKAKIALAAWRSGNKQLVWVWRCQTCWGNAQAKATESSLVRTQAQQGAVSGGLRGGCRLTLLGGPAVWRLRGLEAAALLRAVGFGISASWPGGIAEVR